MFILVFSSSFNEGVCSNEQIRDETLCQFETSNAPLPVTWPPHPAFWGDSLKKSSFLGKNRLLSLSDFFYRPHFGPKQTPPRKWSLRLRDHRCNLKFLFFWAAAPKGAMSCRIQGESMRLFVRPSVHLSDVWMDRWMDRCTHRFPLHSTGHHPLWVCCSKQF